MIDVEQIIHFLGDRYGGDVEQIAQDLFEFLGAEELAAFAEYVGYYIAEEDEDD